MIYPRGSRTKITLTIVLALACALVVWAAPAAIKLTSSSCPNIIQQGQKSGCVTELQNLLNKHSAKLDVDGDFGPATLTGVKSFQSSAGLDVDGLVGPKTKSALYGQVDPPSDKSKVVSTAVAELGTLEGSARANTYGSACGYGGQSTNDYAWCACFVSWVMKQTGATSYRNAAVQNWVTRARANADGLSVVSTPKAGDLVAYDWDNTGSHYDHIGVVRTVSGNTFTTVEGNTGNPSGGKDGVFGKSRSRVSSYKVLFIRLG